MSSPSPRRSLPGLIALARPGRPGVSTVSTRSNCSDGKPCSRRSCGSWPATETGTRPPTGAPWSRPGCFCDHPLYGRSGTHPRTPRITVLVRSARRRDQAEDRGPSDLRLARTPSRPGEGSCPFNPLPFQLRQRPSRRPASRTFLQANPIGPDHLGTLASGRDKGTSLISTV